MPYGVWIFIAIILIVVGVLTVNSAVQKRKQYRKLKQSFGVPAGDHRSLYPAESYWQAYVDTLTEKERSALVDDLTWANLDMDQVFLMINACQSEAGDIRLYKSLRALGDGEELLRSRAGLCQKLEGEEALRLDLQYLLTHMGRHNTGTVQALTLDRGAFVIRYKWLVCLLAVLPFVFFALIFVNSVVGTLLLVLSLFVNLISSYVFKNATSSYNIIFPLAAAVTWGKKLAARLQTVDATRARSIRAHAEKLRPFSAPLFIMGHSNILAEIGMFDAWGLLQLPMLSYFYAVRSLRTRADAIASLYEAIGEVDMACAVLSYRACLDTWCEPAFLPEKRLEAVGLCHPLLSEPVPNCIKTDRSVLLTGSNASGKSTFIKAVAVNCILAQSIFTCTASAFALHRGGVTSAMAIADNLFEGDSYFVAEVKALRRMLRALEGGGFHYLFIDEILRGTNTIERIGASGAFIRYIADANCLCIAATHDIELVSIAGDRFAHYHFSETVRDKQVSFTYRLQEGPVRTRNALLLLESFEFPEEIITKARDAVEHFDETGNWK